MPLIHLPQGQVTLQNLLHHVHCVNDTLGNGVLRLVHSTGELWLPIHNVLEGLTLVLEELLNIILVNYDTFSDNLPTLC